jgi:hypothetical protein
MTQVGEVLRSERGVVTGEVVQDGFLEELAFITFRPKAKG